MWLATVLPLSFFITNIFELGIPWIDPYWFSFAQLWNSSLDGVLINTTAYLPYHLPYLTWDIWMLANWSINCILTLLGILLLLHLLTPIRWDLNHLGTLHQIGDDTLLRSLIDDVLSETDTPQGSVKVFWANASIVNACAYSKPGRKPVIVLTFGLISSMTPPQIKWVIAHELGHIRHGDSGASSVWQSVLRADFYIRQIQLSLYRITIPIISRLPVVKILTTPLNIIFRLSLWLTRVMNTSAVFLFKISDSFCQRLMEYAADRFATYYLGSTVGISTLSALDTNGFETSLDVFASHPPLSKRIAALQRD